KFQSLSLALQHRWPVRATQIAMRSVCRSSANASKDKAPLSPESRPKFRLSRSARDTNASAEIPPPKVRRARLARVAGSANSEKQKQIERYQRMRRASAERTPTSDRLLRVCPQGLRRRPNSTTAAGTSPSLQLATATPDVPGCS